MKLTHPLLVILLLAGAASAQDSYICIYKDLSGIPRQVSSPDEIPDKYKPGDCRIIPANSTMDSPDQMELEGSVRRKNIPTSLGQMKSRWPRAVSKNFKRSPSTAIKDAARAVSNIVKKPGFPYWLQKRIRELDWKIIFIDDASTVRLPELLQNNCHPGWMTPPANIYIVSSRVVNGCGQFSRNRKVSQGELASLLIHEMAHVVEFQMVDPRTNQDATRAEGFASWFETLASDKSSFVKRGTAKKRVKGLATQTLKTTEHELAFNKSAGKYLSSQQYARAASYFAAIENRHGIAGVFRVYEAMGKENLTFLDAIEYELGWNSEELREEALKALR